MKILLPLALFSMLTLSLTGCGDSQAAAAAPIELTPAATYKAGHGVLLTEAGRRFIELQTGEVESHPFAREATAAIPRAALLRTIRGDFVYVSNGDWFLRTPVTVGRSNATHIEITDGLYEGDTIVVQGVRGLSLAEIQALNGGVGCADGH